MTRYTVVWDTGVESQFVSAWVAANSEVRTTLTEIANWVDANLAVDPDQQGRLRDDIDARVVAVPLATSSARVAVTYQILPGDRQVRVVRLTFRTS